jgi:hypothetical protein
MNEKIKRILMIVIAIIFVLGMILPYFVGFF